MPSLPAQRIADLKTFLKGKDYNQDLAIFISLKIHSGKYRFFLYDLKNGVIINRSPLFLMVPDYSC
ncbi:hypothetical protein [Chryseobacterium sp.]|uniref:hypothetical protein n=1 Tax=Chryseobacterium sp. TaxID=1871047 RepID=UPI0025BBD2ED|nr:hypothetical protein [Chryseobacterium sp.]